MQHDGNLVLYFRKLALWKTGTVGSGNKLVLEIDGNLIFYNLNQEPILESNTSNRGNQLVLQNDANLVVYDANDKIIWATDTVFSKIKIKYPIKI